MLFRSHPEFGKALEEAKTAGVEVLFLPCHVEPDELMVKTEEKQTAEEA